MYNLILERVKFYFTRSSQKSNIANIKTRSNFFINSFFSSTITEWNKLYRDIRNSNSLNVFKLSLLKFFRPVANSVFDINNPYGLKLLTILRLGLSHLRYSLLINVMKIDESISKMYDELITKALLYGDDKFDLSCNKSIISSTI